MSIKKLYYWHHRLAFLKAWYFLLPAILFFLIGIHGLRQNYATMTKLRNDVYAADKQNGDIEGALQKLRAHVHGHMNTNLSSGSNSIKPPIQLQARYERLLAAEKERTKGINAQIEAQGSIICGQRFPEAGFNAPRVACIQEYMRVNASPAVTIPDSLYKFDFISPRWSLDLPGVSLLLSAIFTILFIARGGLEYYMRKRLD